MKKGVIVLDWKDYIVTVAQRSNNDSKLWFRYLRKYIDKCGSLFTLEDVESLYHNTMLTPFQRVSLKVAFKTGSETQQHIMSLNEKVVPTKLQLLREKYEQNDE